VGPTERETEDNPLAWFDTKASRLELEILADLLRDVESPRMLEIGAGRGRLVHRLAGRGGTVVALEPREDYVREALARGTGGLDVQWLIGDGHALPFKDGSFSTVLLIRVLHLSTDPTQLLGEIRRVLRREGVLIASYYPEPSWRTLQHEFWKSVRKQRSSPQLKSRVPGREERPGSLGRKRTDRSARAIEHLLYDAGFRIEVRLGAGLEELTGWKLLPDRFVRGLRRAMPDAPGYPCYIGKFRAV
jgi:ubiquinone/menaquinone biosynthesis C-methylase UbiE